MGITQSLYNLANSRIYPEKVSFEALYITNGIDLVAALSWVMYELIENSINYNNSSCSNYSCLPSLMCKYTNNRCRLNIIDSTVNSESSDFNELGLIEILNCIYRNIEMKLYNCATSADKIYAIISGMIRRIIIHPNITSVSKCEAVAIALNIARSSVPINQSRLLLIEDILIQELNKFCVDGPIALILLVHLNSYNECKTAEFCSYFPLASRLPLSMLLSFLNTVCLRRLLGLLGRDKFQPYVSAILEAVAIRADGDVMLLLPTNSNSRISDNTINEARVKYILFLDCADCRNLATACEYMPSDEAATRMAHILANINENATMKHNFQISGGCELLTILLKKNALDPQIVLKLNEGIKFAITGTKGYKQSFIAHGVVATSISVILHYLSVEQTLQNKDDFLLLNNGTTNDFRLSYNHFRRPNIQVTAMRVVESFMWIVHLLSSAATNNYSKADAAATEQFNLELTSNEGLKTIKSLFARVTAVSSVANITSADSSRYSRRESIYKVNCKICELLCYTIHNVAINGFQSSSQNLFDSSNEFGLCLASELFGVLNSSVLNDLAKDSALETIVKIAANISALLNNTKMYHMGIRSSFHNASKIKCNKVLATMIDALALLGVCETVVNYARKPQPHLRSVKTHIRAAEVIFYLYYLRDAAVDVTTPTMNSSLINILELKGTLASVTERLTILSDIGLVWATETQWLRPRVDGYQIRVGDCDWLASSWSFDYVAKEDRWRRRRGLMLVIKRIGGRERKQTTSQLQVLENFYLADLIAKFI